jgi:hypothetical protein
MNRTTMTFSKPFVIVAALGALAAISTIGASAAAQWVPPPAEYIASTEPVYYEGHASYWYGNHWYWHDEHGAWNHYDHEPAALAERRGRAAPARRSWVQHGGGRR